MISPTARLPSARLLDANEQAIEHDGRQLVEKTLDYVPRSCARSGAPVGQRLREGTRQLVPRWSTFTTRPHGGVQNQPTSSPARSITAPISSARFPHRRETMAEYSKLTVVLTLRS